MNESPVAILTGCAGGIAWRLTGLLADQGYRLVATDIDHAVLNARVEESGWPPSRVVARRLDVRDWAAWGDVVERALTSWGRLDLLLNVAGYTLPGYIHEIDPEHIDRHLDVNVKGAVLGTRAVSPQMIRQGSGHIVNFCSLAGIAAAPGLSLYSASKFAVRGFSLAAAQELRPRGVSVTVVCTDAVDTPMLARQVDYPEAAMSFTRPPLSVDEVADVVLNKVLTRRPLEVTIPSFRGWLAKFASSFPSVAAAFASKYLAKGRARQEALKKIRDG